MNPSYHWDEFAEHSWLAVDKDGHVAVVRCAVGNRLPNWISIPWAYLSNLELKVKNFVLHSSGLLNQKRGELISCTDDMIRECGFFILDFPASSDGQLLFFDYESIPERPLHVSQLPLTLQVAANFFTLPNRSFVCKDNVRFSDWVDSSTVAPNINLMHVENKLIFGFGVGIDALSIRVPQVYASSTFYRTYISFTENCRSKDEPNDFLPLYFEWRYYLPLYYTILDELRCLLNADNVSLTLRTRQYNSITDFKDSLESLDECEPSEKILFKDQQRLLATIILDSSPPNGLSEHSSGFYSMSLYTHLDYSEQISLIMRNVCRKNNAAFFQKDPDPNPCIPPKGFHAVADVLKGFSHLIIGRSFGKP